MHAHRDVPLALADHELDVHAVREQPLVVRGGSSSCPRRRGRRRTRRRAGCPGRRAGPPTSGRRRHAVSPSGFGRPMSAVTTSPSMVSTLIPSRVATGIGCGRVGQALLDEVAREDPDAVAAHLAGRAVGVAVVHVPLGVGGLAHVVRRGADHTQYAVAADAGPPVAQRAHPRGVEVAVDGPVVVGQQHEVVLRAVPFQERVVGGHPSIVPGGSASAAGLTTAASSGSSPGRSG